LEGLINRACLLQEKKPPEFWEAWSEVEKLS